MNPNTALDLLRQLMPSIRTGDEEPFSEDDVADAFEALDEWLTNGGALPTAWVGAAATPDKVWVLVIEHEHGTGTSVHTTEASAQHSLFQWVSEWWDHELEVRNLGNVPMPTDPNDAITEYFDRVEAESYALTSETVERETNNTSESETKS